MGCDVFERRFHACDFATASASAPALCVLGVMCEVIDILAEEVEFGKNLGHEETPLEMFDAL